MMTCLLFCEGGTAGKDKKNHAALKGKIYRPVALTGLYVVTSAVV